MADVNESSLPLPEKNLCTYTACFCEENVWKLCESIDALSAYAGTNAQCTVKGSYGEALDARQCTLDTQHFQQFLGEDYACSCDSSIRSDPHQNSATSKSQSVDTQISKLQIKDSPQHKSNNPPNSHISPTHTALSSCAPISRAYAVFISNASKQIPIWKQRARRSPGAAVVWDYHVILLYKLRPRRTLVYDLDTSLPFPCPLQSYLLHALKSDDLLKPAFHRKFRVVPAKVYLRTFASNREHMINKENNEYMSKPPKYPPIKTQESENNIEEFISMVEGTGRGVVMDMAQFAQFFNT